jgi:hypothetical protein
LLKTSSGNERSGVPPTRSNVPAGQTLERAEVLQVVQKGLQLPRSSSGAPMVLKQHSELTMFSNISEIEKGQEIAVPTIEKHREEYAPTNVPFRAKNIRSRARSYPHLRACRCLQEQRLLRTIRMFESPQVIGLLKYRIFQHNRRSKKRVQAGHDASKRA